MKIVSEEFSAGRSAMSIINTEEAAFGPLLMLSVLGFHDVQYDADSVFVVSAHESLVCVCSIGSDDSVSLEGALRWLMVRNYYSEARLQLLGLFLRCWVFVHHLVDVKDCKSLNLRWLTSLIYFLRNVYMLPITLKQVFQIQRFPNKALTSGR